MKSLREIVDSSPQMRTVAMPGLRREEGPQPLGPARWDWRTVKSVLVIRLRSIGDTVLTTPSLFALRRFLPRVRIDVLLEDWVAPVLAGFEYLDNVITMKRSGTTARASLARRIRAAHYDVVYNLHGGTTATLLARATGARHRVGFAHYQYHGLHNHLAPSSLLLWGNDKAHSVEQQLALIGWTGVPVTDRPPTHLAVTGSAAAAVAAHLRSAGLDEATPFAVVHPAASYPTKQWAADKFARVVEDLASRGLVSVVTAAPTETQIVHELKAAAAAPVVALTDLSLPEVTALAARARLFVGNDSGIAHIAAAVRTPAVVIFGSSNVAHWRPWSTAPSAVVMEELPCQPCHGYFCEKFPEPECILRIPVARVTAAVERVLREQLAICSQQSAVSK
jgi:predicted lipopolysaccharide heptosyltransferase III